MLIEKNKLNDQSLENVVGGSSESNLMPITIGATYQGIYTKFDNDIIGIVNDIKDGIVYYCEKEFDDFHGDYRYDKDRSLPINTFRECFILK